MPIVALDGLFQTLFTTWGSTVLTLQVGFVLLLSTQIIPRSEFVYPSNYLNRITPTYTPPGFWWPISDSACSRKINNVAQIPFDFIVVGSGPAGSVIASRLSENPNRKVLLIEAGGDPAVDSMVPQFFPFVANNTNTWKHVAQPSTSYSNAMRNGCPMTCGKQLGGSTETNAMMYVCGNDRDFNSWAAAGNTGWDYNSVQPLMKMSENNTDDRMNSAYHGRTGLLQVSSYVKMEPFADLLEAGYSQLGYTNLSDYNTPTNGNNGFVRLQQTVGGGERCSAYRSFIVAAKNRPNFYVMKNSLVTSVVFYGNKATGVNVKTSEFFCPSITIPATKEVILSAGSLGSPKILLQSGVGRPTDVYSGAAFKANLPVGLNFKLPRPCVVGSLHQS